MAGRGGRGRGRGGLSFNIESLGFQKGEALPGATLEPPPLFPACKKPLPLVRGQEHDYMIMVKKEFADYFQDSPFHVKLPAAKKDIERFSDRYQVPPPDKTESPTYNWLRFPKELHYGINTSLKRKKKQVQKPAKKPAVNVVVDITAKLNDLEKKEENTDLTEEVDETVEEEEEQNKEEEFEDDPDDEMDEGTDYVNSYFDNGEGYLDEDDDGLEESVY